MTCSTPCLRAWRKVRRVPSHAALANPDCRLHLESALGCNLCEHSTASGLICWLEDSPAVQWMGTMEVIEQPEPGYHAAPAHNERTTRKVVVSARGFAECDESSVP